MIISAIMPQHEECNLFLEDFEKSERSQRCDVCNALGLQVLGGSHKRKDTGKLIIPLTHACQFNIAAVT
jgi:hypothetical protein